MSEQTGIAFRSPGAFWVGIACVSAGVMAHLPDFVAASAMRYHMAGMPMSATMMAGMALIVGGLALTAYGLIPAGGLHRPAAATTCAS